MCCEQVDIGNEKAANKHGVIGAIDNVQEIKHQAHKAANASVWRAA